MTLCFRRFALSIVAAFGLAVPGFAQTFAVSGSYPAPVHPNSLAIGNFNGDNLPDLAVVSYSPNVVSIYLASASGGFNPYSTFLVGAGPRMVQVADVNHDGLSDLVVANQDSSDISVLLGNGLGSFGAQRRFFSGSLPYHMVLADVNADGHADAIVANSGGASVSVLLGDGLGAFGPASTTAVGSTPRGVAAADFNGDSHIDIAVTAAGTNEAWFLFGNGSGAFPSSTVVPVGLTPYWPAAADVNADGAQDLLVPNFGAGTVSVLLGNGAGGFSNGSLLTVGKSPRSVTAVDLNGDTRPDLAVADRDQNTISILTADGAGGFTLTGQFGVGFGPFHSLPLDADRDGLLDLIVTARDGHVISVLRSLGGGAFEASRAALTGASPRGIAVGDFNADGRPDVVTANNSANAVSLLLGQGDGRLGAAASFAVKNSPYSPVVGDFNQDGLADIAVANAASNSVSVLRGTGAGSFLTQLQSSAGSGPRAIAAGDLNQDGKLDIVAANYNGGAVSVLTGTGTGTFSAPVALTAGTNPAGVALSDVNGDGRLDIAQTNAGSNDVRVFLATGPGTFGAPSTYATGALPNSVVAADFDGDSRPDLAVTNENGNSLTILRNNGTGGFTLQSTIPVTARPIGIGSTDIDDDGFADVVVASATTNLIGVLLGNGDATFQPRVDLPAGVFARAVAFGDFDADGRVDIVSAHQNANDVWVSLNRTGAVADLGVSITDGLASVRRNDPITYSVTVTNGGPSPVDAVTLSFTLPAALTAPVATPGAGSYNLGTGAWTGLNLRSGQQATLSLSGVVSATASGTLSVNVAVAPPVGTGDPNASNNGSSDSALIIKGDANLAVTISNGVNALEAGDPVTYVVVVTNAGPTTVDDARVVSTLPAVVQSPTWTCVGAGGGSCTPSGSGPIDQNVDLAAGASVTFTVHGTISLSAATGTLVAPASVTVPSDIVDPVTANNTAADADPLAGDAPPVPQPQSVTVAEDGSVAITVHATDADNDPITYSIEAQPAHGTLTGTAPNVTYAPAPNYNGPDSFTFRASDGILSATAVVSITVTAVNDPPVANGQVIGVIEDTPAAVTLTGNDADGTVLSFTVTTAPAHGILTGSGANRVYTPAANYFGPDSFAFVVSDGQVQSAPAVVSITVSSVNDTPTVVAPIADLPISGEGTSAVVSLAGVFADVETAALVLTATSSDPSLVTPTINGQNLNLALTAGRGGVATVTVRATDAGNAFIEDAFVVTVTRPGVHITITDAVRGEGSPTGLLFTVTLSGTSTQTITLPYSTADGTATAGADYVAQANALVFTPGVVSRTLSVATISDLLDESNETVRLLLGTPTGDGIVDDPEGIGTITDNDTATISLLDLSVTEPNAGSVAAVFAITLSTPSAQTVTVNFTTGGGSAVAGTDYTSQAGTVTFPAGSNTPQTVSVPVLGDVVDEVDETFNLTLSGPVNATISRSVGRATILDNDGPPSVSIADASVIEGNSGTRTMVFTLTLSLASEQRTRVLYQTVDGSATAGSDYVAKTGEVTFNAGVTSRTVSVVVNGDLAPEPTESFSVVLHTPTLLTLGDAQGIGTITNDEP